MEHPSTDASASWTYDCDKCGASVLSVHGVPDESWRTAYDIALSIVRKEHKAYRFCPECKQLTGLTSSTGTSVTVGGFTYTLMRKVEISQLPTATMVDDCKERLMRELGYYVMCECMRYDINSPEFAAEYGQAHLDSGRCAGYLLYPSIDEARLIASLCSAPVMVVQARTPTELRVELNVL
jgi:hypothetical protein